jgi:hypothetical protein
VEANIAIEFCFLVLFKKKNRVIASRIGENQIQKTKETQKLYFEKKKTQKDLERNFKKKKGIKSKFVFNNKKK